MKKTCLLVLCMFAFAAGAVMAQSVTRESGGYRAVIEERVDVAAGGRLDVRGVHGSVDVVGWGEAAVSITETLRIKTDSEAEARRIMADVRLPYSVRDASVSIGRERSSRRSHRDVSRHLTLRVPRRFEVRVVTDGGAVTVEGVNGRVDVSSTGGSLTLTRITGRVEAATAGGEIKLRDIDGEVDATTAGGSIVLEAITGRLEATTAGGTIEVRRAAKDVFISTAGGGIEAEDIGGRLDASTAGGSLRIRNVKGAVEASTAGGGISLRDVAGRVEARTYGGDIDGLRLAGALDLETSAGDIDLRDVSGPIEARTAVGDIDVVFVGAKSAAMELRTSHGDIRLALPARVRATLNAELDRHSPYTRHDIYSDFALVREVEQDERWLHVHGDINGGGKRIELRASGGDIRIRRANN